MKKGWLCRTSYDEIVHTWWWLEEIQIEWWYRSSYDDSERSRSSDDPDPAVVIQIEWWSRSSPVMLIQIEWWSRSSDAILCWSRSSDDPDPVQWCWSRSSNDLDPVMPFYDDPDREMIQIQMTWRWRWSSWCREEDECWKLCRKNTFLVKRECWCICNFRMYSYMYFIYCNPMFIPGCFYYVFESYCLTSMFQSGGLIM